MANIVKHKLVSAVTDLGVAGELSPLDWNNEHDFSQGSNGQFLIRDSTQSDGAAWSSGAGPYAIGGATVASTTLSLYGTSRALHFPGTTPEISTGSTALLFVNNAGTLERMRLTDGGILALGTTVVTGAGAGDFVLANAAGEIRAVNAAGTDTLPLLSLTSGNQTRLDFNSSHFVLGNPATQLTIGNNGAASALTANPVAYIRISIGGSFFIVPYYSE